LDVGRATGKIVVGPRAGEFSGMNLHVMDAFSRRFDRFARTIAEKQILKDLHTVRRTVSKRKELVHESEGGSVCYILHEGWICSYKRLADGSRQVVDFCLPGDLVGLKGLFLQTSDRDIETLTDVVISEVGKSQLLAAMRGSPGFTEAVLWNLARDEAIVAQHLVNIGRRSALVRTAHFLLELRFRLGEVGEGVQNGYECPLSQQVLADALGITGIHLNRILRYLREKELVTFSGGTVEFLNIQLLTRLAGFDPSYLMAGV
jgi:CRP-like cAMP-binding protein